MKFRHAIAALGLTMPLLAVHGASYHCVSFEYPPLVHKNADGKAEGAAIEIVNRTFAAMGDKLDVEIVPWNRALQLMESGERDCIFTLYRSPEREKFLDFSHETLLTQVVYFYARKDRNLRFDGDFAALKPLRIGTAFKVNYGTKFEGMRSTLTIDEAPTIENNFMKLVFGRVDLIPSNFYTALATLRQPDLLKYADDIAILPHPIENVPSFIAFSKSKHVAGLRERFDAEFKKWVASGGYKAVLEKYKLGQPDKTTNAHAP